MSVKMQQQSLVLCFQNTVMSVKLLKGHISTVFLNAFDDTLNATFGSKCVRKLIYFRKNLTP